MICFFGYTVLHEDGMAGSLVLTPVLNVKYKLIRIILYY